MIGRRRRKAPDALPDDFFKNIQPSIRQTLTTQRKIAE